MKRGDDNEIVQLHNEGKSYREIGRVIGISHVAARKRCLKLTRVTTQKSTAHTPEKSNITDQISDTAENLNDLSNSKGYENQRKPETLTAFNQKEINKEDVDKQIAGNPPGYQSTVNTEPPAEPQQYYIHRQTKEIFHRNDAIDDEIKAELEPYHPPKYLKKKTKEPNKGGIFAWTLALGNKWDEFEPYDGPLPSKSKDEKG